MACPEDRKFVIPEEMKKAFSGRYKVIDIDGARVEFGDGWGLVRASNTQPVVVVRFEARTPERLREIEETMMTPLRELGVGEAAAH
jgi:phosphomannomutase/phosphoglucomutase